MLGEIFGTNVCLLKTKFKRTRFAIHMNQGISFMVILIFMRILQAKKKKNFEKFQLWRAILKFILLCHSLVVKHHLAYNNLVDLVMGISHFSRIWYLACDAIHITGFTCHVKIAIEQAFVCVLVDN